MRADLIQPAPAPRFSRTSARVQGPPAIPGSDTIQTLTDWGIEIAKVERLLAEGTVRQSQEDK